jgi:hypothetical protein
LAAGGRAGGTTAGAGAMATNRRTISERVRGHHGAAVLHQVVVLLRSCDLEIFRVGDCLEVVARSPVVGLAGSVVARTISAVDAHRPADDVAPVRTLTAVIRQAGEQRVGLGACLPKPSPIASPLLVGSKLTIATLTGARQRLGQGEVGRSGEACRPACLNRGDRFSPRDRASRRTRWRRRSGPLPPARDDLRHERTRSLGRGSRHPNGDDPPLDRWRARMTARRGEQSSRRRPPSWPR